MSLSSSLFTGTSGLKNMGNALQVTGNNIANLNTIGFKKGRSTFADTLYENVATLAGTDQIGRGMAVGDVSQNFNQGSFESTGNATDLSIGGDGFFVVRQTNSENTYYTRAGNFLFNKSGELVNPEGYVVQGWALDEDSGDDVGAIKDIVMRAFTSPPKKSTQVTAVTNLDADAIANPEVLSNAWDSAEDIPMAAKNYEYPTVLKVYDALGSTHDVSIYYDKKSGTEWEYVVSTNPAEDNRNSVTGTDSQGLLARGTILFSQSSGDILDITMEQFTGRLGRFKANGANAKEDIHYQILNSEKFAKDGYGFEFEFDGANWNFADGNNNGIVDNDEIPETYPNATIVYSDSKQVHIALDPDSAADTDPDLKIQLDLDALAADTFGFDINNPDGLHIQGLDAQRFVGETDSNNTKTVINDPSVMTDDSKGLGVVWNPQGGAGQKGEWVWSNPELAASAGTLLSDVVLTNSTGGIVTTTAATTTILNEADMHMVANDINLRYDGATKWDWNEPVKAVDFNSEYKFPNNEDPKLTVLDPGDEGAIATATGGAFTTPKLFWLGTEWSLASSGAAVTSTTDAAAPTLNANIVINTAATDNQNVVFDIWYSGLSSGAATAKYAFGKVVSTAATGSIVFTMDPTPPEEYAQAVITYSTGAAQTFDINFDGDGTKDLTITPTAGGVVVAGVNTFAFSTRPDVPPPEYLDAVLKGDHEGLVIDLDGSGNDNDNDDISFSFIKSLKFGEVTHPWNDKSEIHFDILGSTAWTKTDKSEIESSGYYSFNTDFLGGEFGSTETAIQLNLGSIYENASFVNDSLSTTQYSKSSSTVFQDANGYGAGDLQGVNVASDGIMTGVYSNGQLIPLFRVGLAKFLNNYGLQNEGGNLFKETRDSGAAITNKPGENGLGTLAPNSLEMSNVDISEEFVNMITNQRGFQANSKTITTVDDMMQTVIQMKR